MKPAARPHGSTRPSALADEILARFADRQHGGFFYTAADHEPLIVRKKDVIDNPVPSGNGLAATLFCRLQRICRRDDYRGAAEATLRACFAWMRQVPTGTFQLLLAMELTRIMIHEGHEGHEE